MENISNIVEAILFASGESISRQDLIDKIPELTNFGLDDVIDELKEKYDRNAGIQLLEFEDKLQLSTNPKYGDTVAEVLTPLREKELTKSLLEVLSIIAYKQPITKLELEELKSTSSDYALGGLLNAKLIKVVGRRDTVGRPILYGTTDDFLKKFGLRTLQDLPDFADVMEKVQLIYQPDLQASLFHNRSVLDSEDGGDGLIDELKQKEIAQKLDNIKNVLTTDVDEEEEDDLLPDFLKSDDDYVIID